MVSERALLVYRRALHILYITVNLVFKNLPNRGSDSMGVAIAALMQ